MNKVIVTTDFSANSKKGIHFAMQLASQTQCDLIFYNVVEIFRPSIWDNVYYGQFEASEIERSQKLLEKFVASIHQKNGAQKVNYKCVCEVGMSASNQIISYAESVKANYICVSTTGAGKLNQLFGTIASELITFSPIPVLIVPKNYRSKPIKKIFFASDFKNFEKEVKNIQKFSEPLQANLEVLHYDYNAFMEANATKFDKIMKKHQDTRISFHLRKLDSLLPLITNIQRDVTKMKPSLIVLFTKQNRNWFNRLFLSSLSAEMAFDTTTPLLVFRKELK